uniref:WAPL domain-containing protein n=1 Tax=Ditylenchus dipsaci TaxID=166011 RepID=A0A915DYV3_9BILA
MPARKPVAANDKLPKMRKTRGQTQAMQVESLFPSNAEKFKIDSASSSNIALTKNSASDLFDSLFSSSAQLKPSNSEPSCTANGATVPNTLNGQSSNMSKAKQCATSPIDIDVMPVSLSETSSTTPDRQQFGSSSMLGQKRPSPRASALASSSTPMDEYDFCSPHSDKKPKTEKPLLVSKVFGIGKSKVSYNHKWSDPDGLETEVKQELKACLVTTDAFGLEDEHKSTISSCSYTSFRKVKQAQQCLEYLSTIQLAKKCVSLEFRRFLKTQNVIDKIFHSLADSFSSPGLCLAIATVLYFLARDQKNLTINEPSLRLISRLLKQEHKTVDAEFKKQIHEIWLIIKDWLNNCAEKTTKSIQFDMTEHTLSTSFLMLEALAYIAVREHEQFFKQELLNTGCLQWVVAKFDKAVLSLSYAPPNDSEAHSMLLLKEIERCYRILENAAAFNKRNQAYLINHRNGLLLVASAKFLSFFQKFFDGGTHCSPSSSCEVSNKTVSVQIFDCVCLMSRVLMNVSHENELCCLKLGQMSNFLSNCMSTLTNMAPRYAPKEKFFDICVMMYGLLTNIVERCSANRVKVLQLKTAVYNPETKDDEVYPVLQALTKLFIRHDTAARTIDEELDNDLVFEEPLDGEDSNQEAATTTRDNGRLQRPVELSEDEMLNAVQSAMNKASAHMEDSMIASYVALLIGCLVDDNENLATEIKDLLPDKNLEVMIDQLQRFLEFMKITNLKSGATRSIERIIKSMNVAAGIIIA